MSRSEPLVSIGVPVYNSEGHLSGALDSLLEQDYSNLELIISDNGSKDSTPEIIRQYSARDTRIIHHRVEQNRGAIWNFNRVFQSARGKYFMWAAADDRRDPSYLRCCVECLERDPLAVLCYSRVRPIGNGGESEDPLLNLKVDQPSAIERFRSLLCVERFSMATYALVRRSAMPVPPLDNYYGTDNGFLLKLCLQGRFLRCDETSFYYCADVRDSDEDAYYKRLMQVLDPQKRARTITLPYWKLGLQYLRIAATCPLAPTKRLQLSKDVLRYYFMKRGRLIEIRHLIATVTGLRRVRDNVSRLRRRRKLSE